MHFSFSVPIRLSTNLAVIVVRGTVRRRTRTIQTDTNPSLYCLGKAQNPPFVLGTQPLRIEPYSSTTSYTMMRRRLSLTMDDCGGGLDCCHWHEADRLLQHSPMKKTQSVDFSRLLTRTSRSSSMHDDTRAVASHFSVRAARGSYSVRLNKAADTPASYAYYPEEPASLDPLRINDPSRVANFMMRIPNTLTVGKVSVLILLLATLTDFALSHIHSIEAPDLYEAFSMDVIRPAFRYRSGNTRPSLGSAAIGSVTQVLSPILPFTGGLDLRREDYWKSSGSWYDTLQSVAEQIRDAFSSSEESEAVTKLPRGGSQAKSKLSAELKSKRSSTNHVSSLSASKPFVTVDKVADFTLSDVSEAFRYAVDSSRNGFNENSFMSKLTPRMKEAIADMKEAVQKSRGKDVRDVMVEAAHRQSGEIDALKFCGAMRLFAEWRLLRQVPDGYKGFAVGMNLGYKDVVQNIAKIEDAVHKWLDHQRDLIELQQNGFESGALRELRSPTIRDLLQYEIDIGLHPSLPQLKDKTGAMGVLWVRRQLQYQTHLFDNVVKVPNKFSNSVDAVGAAYKQVYDRYHGWAVQKIFNYSLQAAPQAEEIFKHMNPHKLKDVLAIAREKNGAAEADDDELVRLFDFEERESDNPVTDLIHHVGGEWDKFVSNVVRIFDGNSRSNDIHIRGGSATTGLQGADLDQFINFEMTRDAHDKIAKYLEIAFPLLDDLSLVFDEMNMDDPTKV